MILLDEAIRAGFQPCSYSLHILALVVLGMRGDRDRLPVLSVYYLAMSVFAWIPFLGVDPLFDGRIAGVIGLALGLGLISRNQSGWVPALARMGGAGLVGAFAGATWRPCVGPELGSILTAALRDAWPGLAGVALYLLGVMIAPGILAALSDHIPSIRQALARRPVVHAFRFVGGAIVLSVATGFFPHLLSYLARISSL